MPEGGRGEVTADEDFCAEAPRVVILACILSIYIVGRFGRRSHGLQLRW
jgi:hypothetical protein